MVNLTKNIFISFGQTFDNFDRRCVASALITGAIVSPDFRKGVVWTPVIIASHALAATIGNRIFSDQAIEADSQHPITQLKAKIAAVAEKTAPTFLKQIPVI